MEYLRGIRPGVFNIFEKDCSDFLGFSGEYYTCCVIEIKCRMETPTALENITIHVKDLKKAIRSTLEERFSVYTMELSSTILVYIVNLYDKDDKRVLTDILRLWGVNTTDIELTIGIGRVRHHINNIWKSYSDAMTAIGNRKSEAAYQVVDSDDITISYNILYTFDQEKKILNYLRTNDFKSINKIFIEIIDENRRVFLSHKHMNILFMQLFSTAIRYAAENGLDMKKVSTETEQELFNTDNTAICDYDLKLICLLDFYFRVMEITGQNRACQNKVLVEHIIKYVKDNYCNGLYMEKVASHMDLSSKYISRIFKQRMGISLVDYISLVQIDKSKELLLDTNKTIDEIAGSVGINSRVTFYRLFKKHEGISPSSFRRATP